MPPRFNFDIIFGMKWTKEQEQAINLRGKNILVAAAAGSGKTSVLVERIRKMVVEEEIPIRSFLVVTFTNAAAAEMKERLRTSLNSELEAYSNLLFSGDSYLEDSNIGSKDSSHKNLSAKIRYLKKQLVDLESANISTFHSFGLSVIRRFFYKIDIEPGFSILDETEGEILKEQALDSLLETEFDSPNEDFILFMDSYSGDRNNDRIRDLIKNAHRNLVAMPHSYEWMNNKIDETENLLSDANLKEKVLSLVSVEAKEGLSEALELFNKTALMLDESGLQDMGDTLRAGEINPLRDALLSLDEFMASDKKENYREVFSGIDEKLASISVSLRAKKEEKESYDIIKDAVKELRDDAKKRLKEIRDDYLASDMDESLSIAIKTSPYLRTLLRLVSSFDSFYRALKDEEKVIDFNDIEHYTLMLLEDDSIAEFYRAGINHIFVDEYQDTNLMQEAIINRIKRENNLFMVGDIKQSIYRFRLAEPSIFQNKYELYKSGSEADSVVIDLNENHRSKEPILDYVNKVFEPIMSGYDEDARLNCGTHIEDDMAVYLEAPKLKVVIPLDESTDDADVTDDENKGDEENLSELQQEAHYVARLILDNLGKPFFDTKREPKEVRPLTLDDIVILRRSVENSQAVYQDVLRSYGIESHVRGGEGYFDTMEISGFLDLLKVINNIRQDVSLIGALHSEIFGFSNSDLALIRIAHKDGTFAEAFLKCAGVISDDNDNEKNNENGSDGEDKNDGNGTGLCDAQLRNKCLNAYSKIMVWREMSRTMTLPNFLWTVMVDSGYYAIMGALPDGSQRQSNLRFLCDMSGKDNFYDFLKYVEAIKKGKVKVAESRESSGSEKGVAIMTIHKSKGLEFPMVIVSGLGSAFRKSGNLSFSMHKDIGVGLSYHNRDEHWSKKTLIQHLIESRIAREELEEEIRVLYVALTRARDKLFLVARRDDDKFRTKAELGLFDYSRFLGMLAPSVDYELIEMPMTSPKSTVEQDSQSALDEAYENASLREEILSQLNYKYPYEALRGIKSKYSVSELNKGALDDEEFAFSPGRVPQNKGTGKRLTAAERGTIYHRILERLDFASYGIFVGEGVNASSNDSDLADGSIGGLIDNEGLERKLRGDVLALVESGHIKEEELKEIEIEKIKDFFLSDIGKRCIRADALGLLEKERPFTLRTNREGNDILVQGIIDCYFKENGEIVLLDYKSNWIDRTIPLEDEENRLRRDYSGQLDLYKEALEKSGLGRVCEVYLYLLDIGHGFLV